MSEVLRELQAGYEARARTAQEPQVSAVEPLARAKATRTYTGAPLARRQAWGSFWGSILKAHAHQLRNEANASE